MVTVYGQAEGNILDVFYVLGTPCFQISKISVPLYYYIIRINDVGIDNNRVINTKSALCMNIYKEEATRLTEL